MRPVVKKKKSFDQYYVIHHSFKTGPHLSWKFRTTCHVGQHWFRNADVLGNCRNTFTFRTKCWLTCVDQCGPGFTNQKVMTFCSHEFYHNYNILKFFRSKFYEIQPAGGGAVRRDTTQRRRGVAPTYRLFLENFLFVFFLKKPLWRTRISVHRSFQTYCAVLELLKFLLSTLLNIPRNEGIPQKLYSMNTTPSYQFLVSFR